MSTPCGNCGGEKRVRDYARDGEDAEWKTCWACDGEGVQQPEPERTRFPAVVGNALILADGTTHQLRLLDRLYLRCGVVTPDSLARAYEASR